MALIGVQPVQNSSLQPGHYKPAEKKTDMDKILEGLQIAGSIGGLAVDYQKFNNYAKQNDALDSTAAGNLPAKDQLEAQIHGLQPVAEGTPGSVSHKFADDSPEGFKKQAFIMPQAEPKPLYSYVQNATKGGQLGTMILDMSSGKPTEVGFTPTAKPEGPPRDPRLMTVQDTDANGNPVTKVVPMVAGAEYATTKGAPKDKAVDQDTLYEKFMDKTQNFRGDKAAAQASVNLLSADNALSIINKYPDPNTMPVKQYGLLVQEIGKISSGGVGSEHSQQSIEASTIESKWSELMGKTGGKPQPAELGAFIQDNADYLKDLKINSENVVDAHIRRAWNGVKRQFDDEHVQAFKDDMPDFWAREDHRQKAPKAGAGGGAVADSKGGGIVGTATAAPAAPAGPSVTDVAAELAKRGIKVAAPAAAPASDVPDRAQARTSSGGM